MNKTNRNVLIIHISDIHFTRNRVFPQEKIKRMVALVNPNIHYLEIFLFVTGDIAQQALKEEYGQFRRMVLEFREALEHSADRVSVLVVPGNHDIPLSEERTLDVVSGNISKIGIEAAYDEDCAAMSAFFDLANEYTLFLDSKGSCSVLRDYGGGLSGLDICLLNTAPFSLRNDPDKQLHYLPPSDLELLGQKSEGSIKLILMHHCADWFEDECANQINDLLGEYADLVFIGHEHDGYREVRDYKGKQIVLMRAGETHPDVFYKSEICIVEINLETLECAERRYEWDSAPKLFVEHDTDFFHIEAKRPGWMRPKADFVERLDPWISGLELNLSEIYVFPSFRIEIGSNEQGVNVCSIECEEDFWRILKGKKVVSIAGGNNYGKTSTLSHLYLSSLERGYMPLFLSNDRRVRSLNQLVKTLVREQYEDNDRTVEKYRQYPIDKKILFIDDFDLVDKREEDAAIINNLLESFGAIVFTVDHMINEGITETIRANLGADYSMSSLRIKDFYSDKRADLVEAICASRGKTSDETDEIRNTIEVAVSRHRGLYDLSPDFILRSVQYYLLNGTMERQEEVPYSRIFEACLTKQLEASIGRDYGTDKAHAINECFVFLGEIAAYMHSSRKEHISFDGACEQIQAYSSKHLLRSDPGKVIKAIIDADIMQYEKDPESDKVSLAFTRDTYLAYFVAKWLDGEQKRGNDISSHVEKIVKGLCFRINENILLFLAYLRSQTRFPLYFCEAAYEAIGAEKTLSFDEGTIRFLARWQPRTDVPMALPSERKSIEKTVAAVEEATSQDITISYKGVYDYAEEDCLSQTNRIDRAVKCLRLIGKSLVSLNEVLDAEQKELIIETLLEVPNRVLYQMFHELDGDFDGTAEELHRSLCKNDPCFRGTVDDVKGQIYLICIMICLSLYDEVAFDSSTRSTVNLFLDFGENDTNTRIQNLCMISCAYSAKEFIEYAINSMENAKRKNNSIEISCIRILVNHYLLQHSEIPSALLQKCSEKIFGEKDYKKRLLGNRMHKSSCSD